MKKCIHLNISGKVQGVYFRASTKEKAEELKIAGMVMNTEGGGVYAEAEGEEADLNVFIEWCRQGPPQAKVERVDVREGSLKNYSKFEIVR